MTTHIDPEYQASAIEPQVQNDWKSRKAFKVADTVDVHIVTGKQIGRAHV